MTALGGAGTPTVLQYGITPYHDFIRANTQYYQRADEAGLDITDVLAFWTWVRFHAESTGVIVQYYSKWYSTIVNQRAYWLWKDAGNILYFQISRDGIAVTSVNDGGANYVQDTWLFVAGRFTPNTELTLFIGNGKTGKLNPYTNVAAIPPNIFNSSEPLEVGRGNRTNHLDGAMALWGLGAYNCNDTDIFSKFHQTRPLYMW
jgi:hypothetical protein